jgi:hypothetical protein
MNKGGRGVGWEDVKEKCIDVKVKIPIIYNVCKVRMGSSSFFMVLKGTELDRPNAFFKRKKK